MAFVYIFFLAVINESVMRMVHTKIQGCHCTGTNSPFILCAEFPVARVASTDGKAKHARCNLPTGTSITHTLRPHITSTGMFTLNDSERGRQSNGVSKRQGH